MKGLGKLIGNELFKLWKQTFVRVVAIILLSVIVLYPFAVAGLDYGISALASLFGEDGLEGDMEWYEDQLEWAEEEEEALTVRYYTVALTACRYFVETINGDGQKAWLYEAYGDEYVNACLTLDALRIVDSGDYTDDELRSCAYTHLLIGPYFLEDSYGGAGQVSPIYFEGIYEDFYEEEIGTLEKAISRASVAEYLGGTVTAVEEEIRNFEVALYRAERDLEKAPEDKDLLLVKNNLERYIAWQKDLLKGYRLLSEKGYGPGTWQHTAVNNVLRGIVTEKYASLPVTEPEYEADEYLNTEYGDYDAYLEDCETHVAVSDEPMAVILYAVEHNVRLPYLTEHSSNVAARGSITGTIKLVFYLSLVLGGTLVATEFSRGTVRLLLIRPRTRAKILWSKFLAGGIAIGVLSLFALLWSILWSAVFYDASDLFVLTLRCADGVVTATPALVEYMGAFLSAFLHVVFFCCVAFFFSVVCKKTVLSIVLSFAVNGTVNFLTTVVLMIWGYTKLGVLKYLPFAYGDLTLFGETVTDYYCSWYSGINASLSSLFLSASVTSPDMTAGLLPVVGALWIVLLSALLVFLSHLIFRRTEIKN